MQDSNRVRVGLLGPFQLDVDGVAVHIGSPKQRAVLALLALNAGRVVTSDALCEVVWDRELPASPSGTLQSLISRLRAALPTGDVIRTSEPGWVLDVDAGAVDALRFQALVARARARKEQGDAEAAAAGWGEALSLWRGAALADVVDAGYLGAYATRLNEGRLDAVEDLADAELATGRTADARSRLEDHVESNPLRERAWGLLMVALYRLGRQAAALRAFQQVRAILAEELGIEPSPELAEIERRILLQDPALAHVPAPAGGAAGAARPTPPAGEFADYTVVVVEDHDFQRRTVVQLLRGLGVGAVSDAPNGDDALRLLHAGPPPDVVVCDIDMPGMDGVEFVGRVADGSLAGAVVIASGLESNVLRAVEAIGQSHGLQVLAALPKPLTARRLAEALRQYTRFGRDRAHQVDGGRPTREDLQEALDSGVLAAQFEPRIDLGTGAFSGAAARGCWAMPASVFVPALAREGLMEAYIERLVAASSALVHTLGPDRTVRVAADVSQLPFGDPSLADRLAEMVQSRGQDPRRFVWEVEDVALARAPVTALPTLTRLRVKGFGLAMRHSGGPTGIHQLGRTPFSEVVLDRRLVSGTTSDPKRLAVLEAAVGSGHESGLPVVAEGCDAPADFDMLIALGCDEAQGSWVADPMSAAELVAWALDETVAHRSLARP